MRAGLVVVASSARRCRRSSGSWRSLVAAPRRRV